MDETGGPGTDDGVGRVLLAVEGGGGGGHEWTSSVSKWAPVSSRNTSSSVGVRRVRSRTRMDSVVERDRHRADGRRAVVDADGELVVVAFDRHDAVDTLERLPCRGRVTLDAGDDDVGADAALQLRRRAFRDERAAVDDADPVGELVGLLEVLRGEEDRHAELVVEPLHLLPDAGAADGIEARRRLVEEQHVRVVHQRGGEVEAAPHAAGVRADAAIERVADVDEGAELDQPAVDLVAGQAVELALEAQQLEAGLLRVERDILQGDADVQAHLLGTVDDVEARHRCPAAGRGQEGAQHLDRRGLAGAVGPEQAVDLPLVDGEVKAVDRGDVAEGPAEVAGGDRRGWGCPVW